MASTEIEFELPATQFGLIGYPALRQGQAVALQLETGLLLPDPAEDAWYAVTPETLPGRIVKVGPGQYAFSGQIEAAELAKVEEAETATLLVRCAGIPLRLTCGPLADGMLPFGTWETRYLTGYARVFGVFEENFATTIGERVGATIWGFRRLVLGPGDPAFGEWYETTDLLPSPYVYDRVLVTVRIHRRTG
jgi:hypothetical protein